jgi:hypothetical protein
LEPTKVEKFFGPLGGVIAKTITTSLVAPFAEFGAVIKESKELTASAAGIRAATEFGDGTGVGAERQYEAVEGALERAEVGTDMRDALGREGNTLSAGALGLDAEDSDIK